MVAGRILEGAVDFTSQPDPSAVAPSGDKVRVGRSAPKKTVSPVRILGRAGGRLGRPGVVRAPGPTGGQAGEWAGGWAGGWAHGRTQKS